MSDLFHDQTDEQVVLNIPLEGRSGKNRVNLQAIVGLDGDVEEEVQELLDECEGRPLAYKDQLKKDIVDVLRQHVVVQVEEE